MQYTYDNQGQLLTVRKSLNNVLQKTYTYTYDTYGNIRTATDGTTSHTYTYGDSNWLDLLTAYDGTALTYDTNGNPTSYYNGTSYTMTWRNGRELSTLTKGGKKTSYEYDVDGLRNLKTNADGSYSVYYWLGNLLLAEQRFASATATTPTWTMVFSYDENNTPIGYQLKGTSGIWYYYYYAKNVQGDIVALYRYDKDADGNKVATHIANYEYDPWGKVLSIKNAAGTDLSGYSSNSAVLNPFRYRGYYYDNESGFYYLQSRYYDPSMGRFINADNHTSTGQELLGYNMFAYCLNNPINYADYLGQDATLVLEPGVLEAFTLWLTGVASANWWNAVGWVAAGILATGIITYAAVYLYEWFLEEEGDNFEVEQEEIDIAPCPPPPQNNWHDDDDDNERGGRQKMGHQRGNTPGNNQRQNKQVDSLCKKYKIPKNLREQIHRLVSGQGWGYREIEEYIRELLGLI